MRKMFLQDSANPIEHEASLGVAPTSPYIPEKKPARLGLRQSGHLFLLGGGLVVLLLVLAFSGISHKPSARQKSLKDAAGNNSASEDEHAASITPILDIGAPAPESSASEMATADQIARTATAEPRPSRAATLASVPPFGDRSWQPPPYAAGQSEPAKAVNEVPKRDQTRTSPGDQESLVFVSRVAANAPLSGGSTSPVQLSVRLSPGTRLRARLESEINSAVRSPVVAIIEDNYEEHGMLVISAGSRVIGRLVNADISGFVDVEFDSLDRPLGSPLKITAIATDLDLRPLHGRVHGRATGKNLLVRSVTGMGEVAATLVGRGSLNQPLSEQDMLRERLSNNIGQAGDQQIASLAVSRRYVVSVPASLEIYVVFEKESALPAEKNSSAAGVNPWKMEDPPKLRPGVDQLVQQGG